MDDALLLRFLNHRTTPAENRRIAEWIAADPENADWLFETERIWSLKNEERFSDKKEIEAAYSRLLSELPESRKIKKTFSKKSHSFLTWFNYAAAILLIGLLSANLYSLMENDVTETNRVEVPVGQRASLTLSDGTKVWLNSRSRLIYPARFSSKKRQVQLEGEGYFEVTHKEKVPFIVHAGPVRVRVVGTRFNVKNYPNESSSITLTDGKVEVTAPGNDCKVVLNPNEQVSYSQRSGWTAVCPVNAEAVCSWTRGEAAYINKRLDEITSDLERKFNVHIEIKEKELASEIFNCRYKETATLEQIFTLLKNTRNLDYERKGDTIQIHKPLKYTAYGEK